MEALDSAAPGPTFPFRVALVLGPPHPATPAKVGKSAGAERRVVLESAPFDMKPKTSDGKGARKSADALPFEVDLRKPGRPNNVRNRVPAFPLGVGMTRDADLYGEMLM